MTTHLPSTIHVRIRTSTRRTRTPDTPVHDGRARLNRSRSMGRLVFCGGLILAGIPLLGAPRAGAATHITVTTTDDELNTDGDCSLREAIQAHNDAAAVDACTAGSGSDVIDVPAGSYLLTVLSGSEPSNAAGDLTLFSGSRPLVIEGAGAGITTIDAGSKYRVISSYSPLTLRAITLQGGSTSGFGAAVAQNAAHPLVLDHVVVRNSTAKSSGAVATTTGASLKITDTRLTANVGGALNVRGDMTLERSLIDGNSQAFYGAAFLIDGPGTVTDIVNTTFTGNSAPHDAVGAVREGAHLSIRSSTLVGNVNTIPWTSLLATETGGSISVGGTILDGTCSGEGVSDAGSNVVTASSSCAKPATSTIAATLDLLGLDDNGGSTPTMALGAGSAARRVVVGQCPTVDQRGVARGMTCDAGAFESPTTITPTTITPTTNPPTTNPPTTITPTTITPTTITPTTITPTTITPTTITPTTITEVTTLVTAVAPTTPVPDTTTGNTGSSAVTGSSPTTSEQPVEVLGVVYANPAVSVLPTRSSSQGSPASTLAYTGGGLTEMLTLLGLASIGLGTLLIRRTRPTGE